MIVRGKDVICTVDTGGGNMQPVCCARNASIVTNADIGETSTLGTGKWKTFKGLKMSFTISLGGLVSFDMNYSIAELRQRQINFDAINFTFFGSDDLSNQETYSGSFIVTSISTPSSYNANLEYSMEGQGTGELTVQTLLSNIVYGWSRAPFTQANLPGFGYQKGGYFNAGDTSFVADFTDAKKQYYLAMKYPSTGIMNFTQWMNTATFNYGVLPDQVFYPIYTSGGYSYIYSRVPVALDGTGKQITFS